MRVSLVLAVLAGLITVSAPAADPAAEPDGRIRTEFTLKTPRSREPVLGGSKEKVFFSIWIPEGFKTVRGAVCNPFSKDEGVSKHWQAACRHWQFAYVQTDFDAVNKAEFILLKSALTELAKKSGHPEVEHLPLFFTGMSRGGGMSMQLAELMPERTLASVPVCLEVGPGSEATRQVPVLTVFGEKDGKRPTIQAWKDFKGEREKVCWFPSQRVAAVWQAFVSGTKDIVLKSPAGLGDGQAFVLHSGGKAVAVEVTLAASVKPTKVEIRDAHERLAERTEAPWTFEVRLKPGVHSLIATVTEAGQLARGSRPHTIVVAE